MRGVRGVRGGRETKLNMLIVKCEMCTCVVRGYAQDVFVEGPCKVYTNHILVI